jgi:type IV fimbrial biogenesis protein FimT
MMKQPGSARGKEGFSLVELLITLTVLSVTLSLALPSFATLMRDTRLTAASSDLHAAILYTRSEAIKRSRRVTICTSADGQFCAAGVGWHAGWIVFEDANGDGLRDAGEALLRVGQATAPGVATTGNQPVRDYVSYVATGTTRAVSGALQMGTITACADARARRIVINAVGRPRVERDGVC